MPFETVSNKGSSVIGLWDAAKACVCSSDKPVRYVKSRLSQQMVSTKNCTSKQNNEDFKRLLTSVIKYNLTV